MEAFPGRAQVPSALPGPPAAASAAHLLAQSSAPAAAGGPANPSRRPGFAPPRAAPGCPVEEQGRRRGPVEAQGPQGRLEEANAERARRAERPSRAQEEEGRGRRRRRQPLEEPALPPSTSWCLRLHRRRQQGRSRGKVATCSTNWPRALMMIPSCKQWTLPRPATLPKRRHRKSTSMPTTRWRRMKMPGMGGGMGAGPT